MPARFCACEDEEAQLRVVRLIVQDGWTVAKTERISTSCSRPNCRRRRTRHFVLRDVRVFFNSINHQLDLIRAAGVDASAPSSGDRTRNRPHHPNSQIRLRPVRRIRQVSQRRAGLFGLHALCCFYFGQNKCPKKLGLVCFAVKVLEKSNNICEKCSKNSFYGCKNRNFVL